MLLVACRGLQFMNAFRLLEFVCLDHEMFNALMPALSFHVA